MQFSAVMSEKQKHVHTKTYRQIFMFPFFNDPKLGTDQISFKERVAKHIVMHTYHEIPLNKIDKY